jgi:hypothetical protein
MDNIDELGESFKSDSCKDESDESDVDESIE